MGLKQDVVFKNNFTQKNHPGYGSTPGAFLTDYVARDDATEQCEFGDPSINTIKRLSERKELLKHQLADGLIIDDDSFDTNDMYGRSFGNDGLAYSAEKLAEVADRVQEIWDQGGTVQRMVVSFHYDGRFLKDNGILAENVEHQSRGDYRNHVDQLKLRDGIKAGMEAMTAVGHYQKPLWAGSIQVNTNDIHCHLVLCDNLQYTKQSQRLRYDQEQRGVFSDKERSAFRQGFYMRLQQTKCLMPYTMDFKADLENQKSYQANVQAKIIKKRTDVQQKINQHEKLSDIEERLLKPRNIDLGQKQTLSQTEGLVQKPQERRFDASLLYQNQKRMRKYRKRYQKQSKLVIEEAKLYCEKRNDQHESLQNEMLMSFYQQDLQDRMQICDKYRYFLGDMHQLKNGEILTNDSFEQRFNAWMCGYQGRDVVFDDDRVFPLKRHEVSTNEFDNDLKYSDLGCMYQANEVLTVSGQDVLDYQMRESKKLKLKNQIFDNFGQQLSARDKAFLKATDDELLDNLEATQEMIETLEVDENVRENQQVVENEVKTRSQVDNDFEL